MHLLQASPAFFKLVLMLATSILTSSQNLCPHLSGPLICDCYTDFVECSGTQSNTHEIQDVLANFSSASHVVIRVNNLSFEPDFKFRNMSIENLTLGYGLDTPSSDFFSELGPSLVYLNIKNNSIGHLDDQLFSSLSSLTSLYLDFNELTDVQPSALAGLIHLEHLSIASNSLNEVGQESFQSLKFLHSLVLSHNNITDFKNVNIKSSSLVVLKLDGCLIGGSLSRDTFPDIPNLEELELSYNSISEVKPHALASMKVLQFLNLSHNAIEYLQENAFFELSNLTVLDLKSNKISLVKTSSFSGLLKLKFLDLSRNRLKAFLCDYTADFVSLETINLQDNEIKVFTAGAFYYSPMLKELSLSGNNLECSCDLTDMAYYLVENSTLERKDMDSVHCIVTTTLGYMPITDYKNSKCMPGEPCRKTHYIADDDDYDYDYLDEHTVTSTTLLTDSDNATTLSEETSPITDSSSNNPLTTSTLDSTSSKTSEALLLYESSSFGYSFPDSNSTDKETTSHELSTDPETSTRSETFSPEITSTVHAKVMFSTTDAFSYDNFTDLTMLNESTTDPDVSTESETSTENTTTESETPTENTSAESETSTKNTSAESETSTENTSTESETSTENTSTESETSTKNTSTESETSTENTSTESETSTENTSTESETSTENNSAEFKFSTKNTSESVTPIENTSTESEISTANTSTESETSTENTSTVHADVTNSTTDAYSFDSFTDSITFSKSTMDPETSAGSETSSVTTSLIYARVTSAATDAESYGSSTESSTAFIKSTTEPVDALDVTAQSTTELSPTVYSPETVSSVESSSDSTAEPFSSTLWVTTSATTTKTPEPGTKTAVKDICDDVKLSLNATGLGTDAEVMKNFTFDGTTFCLKWTLGTYLPPKSRCIIKYTFIEGVKSENLACPSFPGDVKLWSKNVKIFKFCLKVYGASIGGSCTKVTENTIPESSSISDATSTFNPSTSKIISESSGLTEVIKTSTVTKIADSESSVFTTSSSSPVETTEHKTHDLTSTTVPAIHPGRFNVTSFEIFFNESSFAYAKWTVKQESIKDTCNLTLTITTQYFEHNEGSFPCRHHTHRLVNVRDDDIFKLCLSIQHKLHGHNIICRSSLIGADVDVEASSHESSSSNSSSSLIPLVCLLIILMLIVIFIVYKNVFKKRQESERYDVRAEEEKSQQVQVRTSSHDHSFSRSSYIAKDNLDI